jgi:hypothetical protein
MGRREIRAQFQRALERGNGRAVIAFFHESGAEIEEAIGESWIELGGFAKFRDLHVYLMLISRVKTGLQVLGGVGRPRLSGKPSE